MEAERRSTMSSLKGQLSNVEGSVKSMKAAVVVGSVLTVACLAAVFGVTVLANEVSKEVKVSNGTLATKAGKSVLTTSTVATSKVSMETEAVSVVVADGVTVTSAVNAVVVQGATTTVICDDLIQVEDSGDLKYGIREGSVLESVLSGETEKRNLNAAGLVKVAAWLWKTLTTAAKARYGSFQTYYNRVAGWLEAAGFYALWQSGKDEKKR